MVRIVSDTTATLTVEEAAKLGVPYLPQIVIFDGKEYRDDCELDTPTFLGLLKNSTGMPKTSAPSPAMYAPVYKRLLDEGYEIVTICPSSDVSGTLRGALGGAEEFPGAPIHVIDTRTVGSGMGNIVRKAAAAANAGASAQEIIELVDDLRKRERIFFLVDTLDFLYKGGRIGGATALIGGVLQIKPILTVNDGHVDAFEKQRTKHKAVERIKELIFQECPHDDSAMLSIMQCGADEESTELARYFERELNMPSVEVCRIPPAIVVHAGPGVLGFSFFRSK